MLTRSWHRCLLIGSAHTWQIQLQILTTYHRAEPEDHNGRVRGTEGDEGDCKPIKRTTISTMTTQNSQRLKHWRKKYIYTWKDPWIYLCMYQRMDLSGINEKWSPWPCGILIPQHGDAKVVRQGWVGDRVPSKRQDEGRMEWKVSGGDTEGGTMYKMETYRRTIKYILYSYDYHVQINYREVFKISILPFYFWH